MFKVVHKIPLLAFAIGNHQLNASSKDAIHVTTLRLIVIPGQLHQYSCTDDDKADDKEPLCIYKSP